jgi:cytochrome P450
MDPCVALADFDPLDRAIRRNPFPFFAGLRDRCPVGWSDRWGGFWVISRYDDALAIHRDPSTFRSGEGVLIPPLGYGGQMIPMESDPPWHTAIRRALTPLFRPRHIESLEPFARAVVRSTLLRYIESGEGDLGALAVKVPMRVTSRLLGIPPDEDPFRRWEHAIIHERGLQPELATAAGAELYRYLGRTVSKRRRWGEGDVVGVLRSVEVEGHRLTAAQVLDTLFFLLLAGLDNTAFAIRNALWYLGVRTDVRSELVSNPSSIPVILEELLRLYSPVPGLGRTAARDVELRGQHVRKGDRLLLLWGAADRDERAFPEPDQFISGREPNHHLAFGAGIHRCLGAGLAMMEMRVVLEEILDRAPEYELVDPTDEEWTLGEATPLPALFHVRTAARSA